MEDETLSDADVNNICEKISIIYTKFMNEEYKNLLKDKNSKREEENICKIIGDNIYNEVDNMGISKTDLARRIGMKSNNGYINGIIKGEIAMSVEKLDKIAKALDVEMTYLLTKH